MATTRTPGKRGDDGRRAELVQAASTVVARDGIAAASTRRIADEAGVPSGLVHYWFAGKDELLQEVLAATLEAIEAAATGAAAASDRTDSLLDRLRAAFQVIEQDDRGQQIALYEMTTWSLRRPGLNHVAEQQYAAYRRVATEAISSWIATAKADIPADTAVVVQFVVALFDGLVLSWLVDPHNTDVDGVLRLAGTLMEQLTQRPHAAE